MACCRRREQVGDHREGESHQLNRMSFRQRTRVLALAAATASIGGGCAAPREAAHVVETVPHPGLVERIYVRPSRPVVGDSLRATAVLLNRGAASQEVGLDCMPSTFTESLPIARPPAPPPDTSVLSAVRCMGVTILELAPGDSIVLLTAAWGPLLAPGRFGIDASLGYGPRQMAVTSVQVEIRPR